MNADIIPFPAPEEPPAAEAPARQEKPLFEDSGYDCRRCRRDIAVGKVFNFPVSREEDLAKSTICAHCRMQLRELAREAGEKMPRIFSLEKTLEHLDELQERRQEEARQRLRQEMAKLGQWASGSNRQSDERKREKRERDRQLRERMKGAKLSLDEGRPGRGKRR